MGQDFKLGFGVDISDLVAGLTSATEAVAAASGAMKESLESVQHAFGLLGEATAALGSALAGGEAFKEMISATVDLNFSSMELGKQFGISATEASQLKVALGETFLSQDTLSAGASRLTRTLNTNEQAVKDLGVQTRDSNGNFRSTLDIMEDVNAKLLTFKEGTDRNVEGTKIYGKGWQEVIDILRLTPEAMEEAKAQADALNLTVSQESLDATLKYKSAMVGLKDTFEGVFGTIGQALLPALTSIGEWFKDVGPPTINATKFALFGIIQTFADMKLAIVLAVDVVEDMFKSLAVDLTTYGQVIYDAITLNWSSIKADWQKGTDDERAIYTKYLADLQNDQDKAAANMETRWKSFFAQSATAKPSGSKDSAGGADIDKGALQALEANLAAQKNAFNEEQAAHGHLIEFMTSQELTFWQNAAAAAQGHAGLLAEINKKIAATTAQLDKQTLEGKLAALKNEEVAAGANLQARLAAEQRFAVQVAQTYGSGSKQYEDAQRAVLTTQNEINKQKLQIDEIYAKIKRDQEIQIITDEQAALKERLTLNGISNASYVSQAKALEDRLTAIKKQGIEARLAIEKSGGQSPIQVAQADAELEALETEHQHAINAIVQAGVAKDQALYTQYEQKLGSGLGNVFNDMISRSTTLSKAFEKMWDGMVQTLVKSLAEMAVKQLAGHLLSMSLNKSEAASNAAVAATAAGKAAAQVPYIGWILSPIAMAAVYAAALAYSAEGGFDIPSGLSPVTQLHPEEMVLPAPIANTIRQAVGDNAVGGGGDGGDGGDTYHVHMNAMDSKSFHQYVNTQAGRASIIAAAKSANQRGFRT